jgi:hypothetical protein
VSLLQAGTAHRHVGVGSGTRSSEKAAVLLLVSLQFGSSSQAVFFKMRVAGVLHIFQFETRQGEDICMALQTHINDIMMKRYSKVRRAGGGRYRLVPGCATHCPCLRTSAQAR